MDISTRALTKVYGSRTVLAGIDLHIPTASQVAFTGPSGVGKTTLLYLLSGIIAPSSGEIYRLYAGKNLDLFSNQSS